MRRTYLLKLTIVLHEMNLFMYRHHLIIQMCDYISVDFREFQSETFCLYRISSIKSATISLKATTEIYQI